MADVGCLSVSSTALTVGNGCITFISSVIPFLRTYFFDFGENVEELRNRKREVQTKKKDYDVMQEEATREKKIPKNNVVNWIEDYVVTIEECDHLENDLGTNSRRVWWSFPTITLSNQLLRMTQRITELSARYDRFNGVSNMFVDQPLETVVKRSIEYKTLNSMEENKKKVYAALKDEMVIRLFGMGGVGKTTLMEQINDEMSDKTDFKLVIWVKVSTTFADIETIQKQISRRLKLEWNDSEVISVRANNILEYLKKHVDGNVLFIFDDVWKKLDLNAIGIPVATYGDDGRKCCKIGRAHV